MLRIKNFKSSRCFSDVASFELLLFLNACSNLAFKVISYFSEAYLLQVKNNFCYIFHYTFDGGELMQYTRNFYAGDRITFQRRQKNSAQRITNRYSISFFKRFKSE